MVSDDRAIFAPRIAGIWASRFKKSKKKRKFGRKLLQRRLQLGFYKNLMEELALKLLRMDVSTFEELLALASPQASKEKKTPVRKAIPATERTALTLRYFAKGETQSSLSYQFCIAQNTVSGIIPDFVQPFIII
ncbi:protein ALP1-like [Trichonephila clavata]|uniref:Protein ALP1-like n=1 Tax=Trichonephila clavata TaxID=2740835 RepID=A0A8X6HHC4_TRICU|nr:protein ALP1-like [Trichonephila clavata]